jgi:hypothetical protein
MGLHRLKKCPKCGGPLEDVSLLELVRDDPNRLFFLLGTILVVISANLWFFLKENITVTLISSLMFVSGIALSGKAMQRLKKGAPAR